MPAVEITPDSKGDIDEIVAENCAVHIERTDKGRWHVGVKASDGTYYTFVIAANGGNAVKAFLVSKEPRALSQEGTGA